MAEPAQRNIVLPDFGEPLDEKLLQNFAKVEKRDLESAVQWFDEHASEDWVGALDAPPFED